MQDVPGSTAPPARSQRTLGRCRGLREGPTLVVVAGIHGNEPAGVRAARRVAEQLELRRLPLRGEFAAFAGNVRALARNVRYIQHDLNRLWTAEAVENARQQTNGRRVNAEDLELRELAAAIESTVEAARGDVHFLDLHTTSAGGPPFATLGDTLLNRAFGLRFPVSIVLGLEEELSGTLLEYANSLGHVTMGFEAGQHQAASSVDHHEALIWTALVAAGLLEERHVGDLDRHRRTLERASRGLPRVFEIRYRHAIAARDQFRMVPGFSNFQPVRKGQLLAHDRDGTIRAPESGRLLLPLYQGLGDDGFFLGRSVRHFWLRVSAVLRRLPLRRFVRVLPGIHHHPEEAGSMLIDTRIARFFPLEIFHLLGYRRRRRDGRWLVVTRRPHDLARAK